eukprot:1608710-Karenia_brevis.AAC.1
MHANGICDSPAGVLRSLAEHWKPFLSGENSEVDGHRAKQVLNDLELNSSWDWSRIQFPNLATFRHILHNAVDNSP